MFGDRFTDISLAKYPFIKYQRWAWKKKSSFLTDVNWAKLIYNIWGIKFGWMAAELLIWHVFHYDLQRHFDCCPESFQRLLKAFIAQSSLNSLLKFESNDNFTVCEENCAWSYCRYKRKGGGYTMAFCSLCKPSGM